MSLNKRQTPPRTVRTNLNVGTLYVRGLNSDLKKQQLANDMSKYNITILAIQETKLKEEGITEIITSDKKKTYEIYHTGSKDNKHHGVGIVIEKGIDAEFKTVSNRICTAKIKIEDPNNQRNIVFISSYAPTLEVSEKSPKTKEEYYEELESVINTVNCRDILIVGSDQNAKTGLGREEFPEVIGKYGKGEMNTNGRTLAETCMRNEMILCNTQFPHKMAHRTTWEAPMRKIEHKDKNGEIRRNPYRNQIDYIMMWKKHRIFLEDARSCNGIETNTDHRLVKAKLNIKWYKIKTKPNMSKLNVEKLKNPEQRSEYHKRITEALKGNEANTPQEKWSNIVKTCINTAEEVVGRKTRSKKSENEEIINLSEKQKKLRLEINKNKNKQVKEKLQKERNETLKQLHKKLEEEEMEEILEIANEVEAHKDDSRRMFQAVKYLQKRKEKTKIIVDGEDGKTTNETKQVKIVSQFFSEMFSKKAEKEIIKIEPQKMKVPFTTKEIKEAAKSLKKRKSVGIDNLNAELIKYGPEILCEGIAEIFNEIAETGKAPEEIKDGVLIPIPKPGKKAGPPSHLRPIILLSILRKILAICMLRRSLQKLPTKIPPTQAAYQQGRSTTELVFTLKILAEKAITSENYEIVLLLLDMSKPSTRLEDQT